MAFCRSLLAFASFTALVASLSACGDGGTSGSGGSGGSTSSTSTTTTSSLPEPDVHRSAAADCPSDRPAGSTGAGPDEGECTTDADCAAGANGRCIQDLGKPRACSYDECAADADCGGGSVCECRNPARHDANVCVHGNCRTDADCGEGGYCSPSAVTLDPFCTEGVPIGSVGYFCHAAEDECTNDDDCGGSGSFPACFFDVDKLHFACFEVLCVN